MKEQIKSKERVSKHGEVFTNEREVNAMLDLVKYETERIESRFLEPACGDALTMLQNNGESIVFAQWDLVIGSKIKRRDYRLDQLMKLNDENPVGA